LLRYLAVAHYGRGRGDWVDGEYPAHWKVVVDNALEQYRPQFDAAWELTEHGASAAELQAQLEPALRTAARETLVRLYPQAAGIFEESGTQPRNR
jgi:hypothetical protein